MNPVGGVDGGEWWVRFDPALIDGHAIAEAHGATIQRHFIVFSGNLDDEGWNRYHAIKSAISQAEAQAKLQIEQV